MHWPTMCGSNNCLPQDTLCHTTLSFGGGLRATALKVTSRAFLFDTLRMSTIVLTFDTLWVPRACGNSEGTPSCMVVLLRQCQPSDTPMSCGTIRSIQQMGGGQSRAFIRLWDCAPLVGLHIAAGSPTTTFAEYPALCSERRYIYHRWHVSNAPGRIILEVYF